MDGMREGKACGADDNDVTPNQGCLRGVYSLVRCGVLPLVGLLSTFTFPSPAHFICITALLFRGLLGIAFR
jgi:hypothetical protein